MIRVLLAKPGLDGHDRGIKSVALALRDAGAEVIYLGMRQSAEDILAAAMQEDVDVVGISILSGAHLLLGMELLTARSSHSMEDLPIVIGGTIPREDAAKLREWGASAVFPTGSSLDEVVESVFRIASSEQDLRYE